MLKFPKISENLKKFRKKNNFFFVFLWKFSTKKNPEKNANLLVLPIEEINILPELSSPAHIRIKGGTLSMMDK